ncbi:MAG: recombination protein RecR [Lentisphaerae bacterium]|nr:recombination protein RecR [Lentisphaerota bacterium]
MKSLDAFDRLLTALARLPGVGRRSAERMALKLVIRRETLLAELTQALADAGKSLRCCSRCGAITAMEEDPCPLCTDTRRERQLLCVVEDPGDILSIEKTGDYRGGYFALMGKLSPMSGEGLKNLRLGALLQRVKDDAVKEVILALNADVEGEATASYLRQVLSGHDVKVSHLAFGLPVGGGVAWSDATTLGRAIQGRRDF